MWVNQEEMRERRDLGIKGRDQGRGPERDGGSWGHRPGGGDHRSGLGSGTNGAQGAGARPYGCLLGRLQPAFRWAAALFAGLDRRMRGGKRLSGKMTKGNPYLRAILVEIAWVI